MTTATMRESFSCSRSMALTRGVGAAGGVVVVARPAVASAEVRVALPVRPRRPARQGRLEDVKKVLTGEPDERPGKIDAMNNDPNWVQVVSALGGLAGFSALTIELWRSRRRKNRPPVGLVESLLWLKDALGEVIARGGMDMAWFLEPERRRQELLLTAINGQIVDGKLNELVGKARVGYLAVFIHADDIAQTEVAKEAQFACEKALGRTNELIRKFST